ISMIAIAHFVAVSFYLAASAVAALPFARRVKAPVLAVVVVLLLGIGAHATGLAALTRQTGAGSLTGLGPALSFAGLVLAISLVVVESLAREVSLTLVAAPVAALVTMTGNLAGLHPFLEAQGARAVWLSMHIILSFIGIAAYATAAAAGTMYLVARRELKSAHFGAIFRFFPPLDTLDRVNHLASIAGFLGLTLGLALAAAYSLQYRALVVPQLIWGLGAWIGVSALALGRVLRGWQARRAALMSALTFASVVLLYVVFRIASLNRGQFL
ncbi:MAG TPA: cytochrome c biogenesis protein CcsA, partial [Gemmatimonadaceae bacterium]